MTRPNRIREAPETEGLHQHEVAHRIGMAVGSVSQFETSAMEVSLTLE